jgi:hypothetical protein
VQPGGGGSGVVAGSPPRPRATSGAEGVEPGEVEGGWRAREGGKVEADEWSRVLGGEDSWRSATRHMLG